MGMLGGFGNQEGSQTTQNATSTITANSNNKQETTGSYNQDSSMIASEGSVLSSTKVDFKAGNITLTDPGLLTAQSGAIDTAFGLVARALDGSFKVQEASSLASSAASNVASVIGSRSKSAGPPAWLWAAGAAVLGIVGLAVVFFTQGKGK